MHSAPKTELSSVENAYRQSAEAATTTPINLSAQAVLGLASGEPESLTALQAAMTDPAGTIASRAFAAVAASRRSSGPDLVVALQTAIQWLQTPSTFNEDVWTTLAGERPTLGDLEARLGSALLAEGDTLGALAELKRAYARDPKNTETARLLAEAHVLNGQLGSALAVLDGLVINLRNTGKLEAMVETLRRMAALAPENIRVKSRLIDSYLQRGFVDDAKSELLARASLEERSGRISDAVVSLQRSADLSWSLGRHEEAFTTYQRLIALAPDDAGVRSSLVNLYLQLGRITDAAEHQRAVVDISMRTGSPHEAIAALHQVIGLTPDDASAYYQLGELLQSMGEHQQAEKVYKRLVLMNPNDYVALEKLSQVVALKQIDASNAVAPAL